MLSSEAETTQALEGCMNEGQFMADEQVEFAMTEVAEQKLLCEKLVKEDAVSGLSNFSSLSQTERVNLYDMLKAASEEGAVNQFEMETFLTRYADEGITTEKYLEWLKNARANMLTETENSYEDLYNYLRKQKRSYAKNFKKNAAWPEKIKFPATKAQLTSKYSKNVNGAFADLIGAELRKHGITLSEFHEMRKKPMNELSQKEIDILKSIRDAVPKPDKNTVLQKTIPAEDIDKYIGVNGRKTIRGYIAKRVDVEHLRQYDDVRKALRLDYVDQETGNIPFHEDGDTYGYIKFQTEQADNIGIPYGKRFGGNNTDGSPCKLNGFVGSENGEITPEWREKNKEPLEIKEGAELHKVVNGEDDIIAVFRDGFFDDNIKK